MFRTISDFEERWQQETTFTQNIMNALTDASLSQPVKDGFRTLGRLAWHITMTIPEMMSLTGLQFEGVDHKAPVPKTAAEIAKTYASLSKMLLDNVTDRWNDASLMSEDDMYGSKWEKGVTLLILISHEVHHRGQMTVLMRQAGLVVPSIYGPAKEGWSAYGMTPPEV